MEPGDRGEGLTLEGKDWWRERQHGGRRRRQWRCWRVPAGLGVGRTKTERASRHKIDATSRRSGSTSKRSRKWSSQGCNVEIQRRDVTERVQNQRRDVQIQLRNVPENDKTDVVTLRSNIATF